MTQLKQTLSAIETADRECLDHTADEFGIIAVLGQAEDRFRAMGEGGDIEAIAVAHAIQIVFALMADVNL